MEYMEKLNRIDTAKVKPTAQVTGLANVMRADEVKPFKNPAKIIKNAPDEEEGQIKVPGVFQ